MLCDRCQCHLERAQRYEHPPVYVVGPIKLDMGNGRLSVGRQSASLSWQGKLVLECLMERPGRLVSSERIWHEVSTDSEPQIVHVLIHRVRKALGRHHGMVRCIIGAGYMIQEDREAAQARAAAARYRSKPEIRERRRLAERERRQMRKQKCPDLPA